MLVAVSVTVIEGFYKRARELKSDSLLSRFELFSSLHTSLYIDSSGRTYRF